jgi:hypothetical protein
MTALCRDCGVDTTPCTGKRGCRHKGRWQYYMVRAEIWAAAGMQASSVRPQGESDGDFLCIPCLEGRLGRALRPDDFPNMPVNCPDPWDTPLLAARKRGELLR